MIVTSLVETSEFQSSCFLVGPNLAFLQAAPLPSKSVESVPKDI